MNDTAEQMAPATPAQMACAHPHFAACVDVARLEDSARFMAEIHIKCTACGLPFHFLGCALGLSFEGPMVAPGGTELRIPIAPGVSWPHGFAAAQPEPPETPPTTRLDG